MKKKLIEILFIIMLCFKNKKNNKEKNNVWLCEINA